MTNFYKVFVKDAGSMVTDMMSKCIGKKEELKDETCLVLIVVRIPPTEIDIKADEEKIQADLTNMSSSFITKNTFNTKLTDRYNMFDSRERIEAIVAILK